jgi:hypothetical protein
MNLISKHVDFFEPTIAGHQGQAQPGPAGINIIRQAGKIAGRAGCYARVPGRSQKPFIFSKARRNLMGRANKYIRGFFPDPFLDKLLMLREKVGVQKTNGDCFHSFCH